MEALDPAIKPSLTLSGYMERLSSLDEFLCKKPATAMWWFFQRREVFLSQKNMTKWSRHRLDDYVLLPAVPGIVGWMSAECFFVSHYWHSKDCPDFDGKYLRLLQQDLQKETWSYI